MAWYSDVYGDGSDRMSCLPPLFRLGQSTCQAGLEAGIGDGGNQIVATEHSNLTTLLLSLHTAAASQATMLRVALIAPLLVSIVMAAVPPTTSVQDASTVATAAAPTAVLSYGADTAVEDASVDPKDPESYGAVEDVDAAEHPHRDQDDEVSTDEDCDEYAEVQAASQVPVDPTAAYVPAPVVVTLPVSTPVAVQAASVTPTPSSQPTPYAQSTPSNAVAASSSSNSVLVADSKENSAAAAGNIVLTSSGWAFGLWACLTLL